MTDPDRAPTIAQIPLGSSAPAGLRALAEALRGCDADYVLPSPSDLRLAPGDLAALQRAVACDPDADAFRFEVAGLPRDPAWRGRRCRSHERNLESLRFASIIAPGALLARRSALLAALDDLPSEDPAPGDAWRRLCLRFASVGRIAELDLRLRRERPMNGEAPHPSFAPPRRCRVLVLGQIEVSTSLYFDFLEATPDLSLAFRPLTRLQLDAPALAAADLVVLVRELHRFWDDGVIAFLDAAAVPYVYFTDDNFMALRSERHAGGFYTLPRMQAALAGASAVWTSTDALAAAHLWRHANAGVWPPVLDPCLNQPLPPVPPNPGGPLTVAIAGGDFRLPGLAGAPLERLAEIAEGPGLRLVATPAAAERLRPSLPRAEIIVPPPERSFRQFIRAWRRYAPDLLLHPAGATANAPYKSPTAAIVAGYLGAVPVVADEPAYQGWGEAEGLVRLEADARGLGVAAKNARDGGWRAEMRRRLAEALARRLSPDERLPRLVQLSRRPPARNAAAVAANELASAAFARGQVARRLIRLTRPIRDQILPPG